MLTLAIKNYSSEEVYDRTGISFQTERNFSKITEQNLAAQFIGAGNSSAHRKGTKKGADDIAVNNNSNSHSVGSQ
jgi:hypothetical protein